MHILPDHPTGKSDQVSPDRVPAPDESPKVAHVRVCFSLGRRITVHVSREEGQSWAVRMERQARRCEIDTELTCLYISSVR